MQMIRYFSRVEKLAPYQALELQLFRTASLFVMDMLRAQVGRPYNRPKSRMRPQRPWQPLSAQAT